MARIKRIFNWPQKGTKGFKILGRHLKFPIYNLLFINDYLTWPAGPKTLPCGAVERLPSGKLASILTYFRGKVNENLIADDAD
jgi:hypothetical protein